MGDRDVTLRTLTLQQIDDVFRPFADCCLVSAAHLRHPSCTWLFGFLCYYFLVFTICTFHFAVAAAATASADVVAFLFCFIFLFSLLSIHILFVFSCASISLSLESCLVFLFHPFNFR